MYIYSTLAINRQVRKKRKTPNQTHQYMHVHVDINTKKKPAYTKTYNHTKEGSIHGIYSELWVYRRRKDMCVVICNY